MIFHQLLAWLSPPLLWIPKEAYLFTIAVLFVLVLLHQRARRAFKKRLEAFEAEKNYDVHVRVISAENLLAADPTGASDPYVTVEYAHLSLSTGMRIQTLFPVWDETLRFPVRNIGEHGEILFTVYDWDLFSADDFLGRASLKLRGKLDISRILKEEVKLWLPLHGVPKGKIQVGLRVALSEKHKSKEGAAHVKFLEKRRKKLHSTVGKLPPGYMESILGLPEGEALLEGGFGASILANKQLLMGTMFITENFLCFHLNDTHPSGLYSSAVVLPLLDILNASPRDIDVIQPSIPGVMVQVKPLSKVEAKEGEKSAADENQDLLDERLEYLLPWSMDGGGIQQLRKFRGANGKDKPVQFFFSEFRDGWRRSDILDFFKSVAKHIAEVSGAEEDTEATGPLIRVTQPELIFQEEISAPCSSLWTWCYDTGATVQQKHFEARKEFDIDILPWKVSPEGTNILMRSLRLKSPIRIPFAPPVAHVKKRQRCLQGKGSFTIEEASVTPNVPYGDCFVVESTWKYQDLKPGVCKVEVYAGVYFTKSTMMKGKITSSSVSSMKEAVQLFVTLAKEEAGQRSG